MTLSDTTASHLFRQLGARLNSRIARTKKLMRNGSVTDGKPAPPRSRCHYYCKVIFRSFLRSYCRANFFGPFCRRSISCAHQGPPPHTSKPTPSPSYIAAAIRTTASSRSVAMVSTRTTQRLRNECGGSVCIWPHFMNHQLPLGRRDCISIESSGFAPLRFWLLRAKLVDRQTRQKRN